MKVRSSFLQHVSNYFLLTFEHNTYIPILFSFSDLLKYLILYTKSEVIMFNCKFGRMILFDIKKIFTIFGLDLTLQYGRV